MISNDQDNLGLTGGVMGKEREQAFGGRRGTESRDFRGWSDVRYGKNVGGGKTAAEVFNFQDNYFCQSGAAACKQGLVPFD